MRLHAAACLGRAWRLRGLGQAPPGHIGAGHGAHAADDGGAVDRVGGAGRATPRAARRNETSPWGDRRCRLSRYLSHGARRPTCFPTHAACAIVRASRGPVSLHPQTAADVARLAPPTSTAWACAGRWIPSGGLADPAGARPQAYAGEETSRFIPRPFQACNQTRRDWPAVRRPPLSSSHSRGRRGGSGPSGHGRSHPGGHRQG